MTQNVAMSWVVLERTHDAIWLGMITAVTWIPVLVLGPWVGALVDRVNRRALLITTQTLFVVVGVVLCMVAVWAPRLPVLLTMSLISGLITAFDMPARQVYVVDIVGTERIAGAVSLYEVTMNASRVIGPALGGLLLGFVGAWACFLANALAFLPPLWVVIRSHPSRPRGAARAAKEPRAVRDGLRYVSRKRQVRACLPMAAASGMLFNLGVALPVFASRTLHLGGGGYGALAACFGLGAVPGAVLAAGTGAPTGRQVRALAAVTAVLTLLLAWSPIPALAFVGIALAGFAGIWFIAAANTLVQLQSSERMRGRVMAAWSMALPGTQPVTSLLVAGLTQLYGARAGLTLAGLGLALTTLAGWRALSTTTDVDLPNAVFEV